MKILCLKPVVPVRIETKELNGRGMDRIVTTDSPGDNVEYFFEDNAERLGAGFAAVRVMYDNRGNGMTKSVLLAPYKSQADKFGISEVSAEAASWLRVCLTLAQAEYSPWLKEKEKAYLRASHWFRAGDFNPKKFQEIGWYTAIRWKHWREQKLDWKQCVADLEITLGKSLTGDSAAQFESFCDRLRKVCVSAGLKRDW